MATGKPARIGDYIASFKDRGGEDEYNPSYAELGFEPTTITLSGIEVLDLERLKPVEGIWIDSDGGEHLETGGR